MQHDKDLSGKMDDRDDQLMRCFAAAFPSATRDEIRAARTFDSIPGCDSLQTVNLLAILDDELGVQIDLTELPDEEPYEAVRRYLLQHGKMLGAKG